MKVMTNARDHPLLVPEMRHRLRCAGVPWVMENVVGAPLNDPIMLCGSMFGLRSSAGHSLRRHRLFECEPRLFGLLPPCSHTGPTIGVYGDKARDMALEKRHYAKPKATRGKPVGVVLEWHLAEEAMGADWMTRHELSESIPPAYTEFIGQQLRAHLEAVAA